MFPPMLFLCYNRYVINAFILKMYETRLFYVNIVMKNRLVRIQLRAL